MSITEVLLLIGAAWLAIGVVLALVMGRRGYDPFVWWLLGTLLGPLAIVLALVSTRGRRHRAPPQPRGSRVHGLYGTEGLDGRVDLLAGLDGSSHATAALEAALELLGDRLGRVALVTVLPLDDSTQRRLDRSAAQQALEQAAGVVQARVGGVPKIVLASGYPADELERLAFEDSYDLLVVGARGAGLSTALLGSTATRLAARGRVPVLVAGGDARPSGEPASSIPG